MTIEGRISVDALFQDKDGGNRMKVAALQISKDYTTGTVAVVTGTANTSGTLINLATIGYRNAAGETATYSSPTAIVLMGTPAARITEQGASRISLFSSGGVAACGCPSSGGLSSFSVAATSGTVSYTLLIYKA